MSIDWLALVIALTGLAGALLLGIDVVLGPGQRFQAENVRIKLENLKRSREFLQQSTRALKQPPYTAAEIRDILDEEERKWGPEQRLLEQEADRFTGKLSRYENRIISFGVLGAMLLVLSFLMQARLVIRDSSRESTAEHPATASIVGTWLVNDPNAPFPAHMYVFNADGTVQQANPDAGDAHASDSDGKGMWIASGDRVRGKWVEVTADRASHKATGRLEITFQFTVKGDTFTGTESGRSYDEHGKLTGTFEGRAQMDGKRITLP